MPLPFVLSFPKRGEKMINFSRPENARLINRLKVLDALRFTQGLSRAQLAKQLRINKVSMGEIVQELVDEGMVLEGTKQNVQIGRPGTSLSLNENHATVIGVDIGTRVVTITLYSLFGKAIRMERYPSGGFTSEEDYHTCIDRAVKKFESFSPAPVIGMCIAINASMTKEGKIESCFIDCLKKSESFIHLFDSLPFPVTLAPALIAACEAERFYFQTTLENMLFINWGEHISSAIILKDRILPSLNFAHIPVAACGLCHCGSVGCLETVSSGFGLLQQSASLYGQAMTGRDMIKAEERCSQLLYKAAEALAKALVFAVCSTGVSAILIGGGLSNLPDKYFAYMLDVFSKSASISFRDIPIYRSYYKEKGTAQGAGLIALDEFFFRKNLLLKLEEEN